MALLLHLPDELLVQVASYLDFLELVALQKVCLRWRDIMRSNVALQYALELRVAGMLDNPASRLVPVERLRMLQAKEKAWMVLDMSDKRSLTLSHRPSGIYDLTGGTLLLGERRNGDAFAGTDAVHTVRLHSVFSDNNPRNGSTLWSNLDLGKQVIDVGLAIPEHDLIAIVTYSYLNDAQLLASIDIHLLKHSTGQPHPAAAKPVIHLDDIHYLPGHCSIMLEISGDSLCFLLNNYFPFINADPVTFVVYNWKTGQPLAGQKRLYSDPTMFNSFVMLSPDTLLFPIIPTNALEICQFTEALNAPPPTSQPTSKLPEAPDVPLLKTSCVLELPPLNAGALVLRMTCRCEPNPRGSPSSATYADNHTPFAADPEKAVMILHMHLRLPTGVTRVYTMIVHRASLLKAVHAAMERRLNSQTTSVAPDEAAGSSNGVQPAPGEKVEAAEGEDEEAEEAEDVPFAYAGPARPRRLSHWLVGAATLSDDEDEGEATAEDEPVRVPWAEWGPSVTRWFQDELAGTRWITTTCGQRFVRVRANGRIRVYDFNKLAIRRYRHGRSLGGFPVGSLPGEDILEEGYTELSTHMELDDREAAAEEEWEDVDEEENDGVADDGVVDEVEQAEQPAVEDGERTERMPAAAERRLKVVLGSTMIPDGSAWEETLVSSLPYMETSVAIPDQYESALLDEDIIVGLKMDTEGRHIREVVLHRIGGPIE